MSVLLRYTAAPILARVEGDAYGVYDIRPMRDFQRYLGAGAAAAGTGASPGGAPGSGSGAAPLA